MGQDWEVFDQPVMWVVDEIVVGVGYMGNRYDRKKEYTVTTIEVVWGTWPIDAEVLHFPAGMTLAVRSP